jgi:N-acetylmuramoyl-L-alanine amidase
MKKICIDVGHAAGTGARGNGLEEHGVAVQIATYLARYLRGHGHTVSVIDYPQLSNDGDLAATVRAINAGNYDLSVSLHCDSSDNPKACGAHVCHHRNYHDDGTYTDSVQGKALAQAIAVPLCTLLPGRADTVQARPDKTKKLTSLKVLRETRPPAVLCECSFISNANDAEMMKKRPEIIAQAIGQGILDYIDNGH